jgi:hypothetical protein
LPTVNRERDASRPSPTWHGTPRRGQHCDECISRIAIASLADLQGEVASVVRMQVASARVADRGVHGKLNVSPIGEDEGRRWLLRDTCVGVAAVVRGDAVDAVAAVPEGQFARAGSTRGDVSCRRKAAG